MSSDLDLGLAVLRGAAFSGDWLPFSDQALDWVRVAVQPDHELHRYLADVANEALLDIMARALVRSGFRPDGEFSEFPWEFWRASAVCPDRLLWVDGVRPAWEGFWWSTSIRLHQALEEVNAARHEWAVRQPPLEASRELGRFRRRFVLAFEENVRLRASKVQGRPMGVLALASSLHEQKSQLRELTGEVRRALDAADGEVSEAGTTPRFRCEDFLQTDFLRWDVPHFFATHLLSESLDAGRPDPLRSLR